MATYVVDGQPYYFVNEIGQEKAEEIIAKRKGQSTDITEEPEGTYEDPKYEGFFTEAGEGVASGAIGILQGLAETATLVPDLIFDTNYGSAVTKFANDLRDAGGIDPAGAVGKITEAVVQFGIPGITAANVVSKAGRVARIAKGTPKKGRPQALSKSQRFGLAAKQVGAAGLADAIVSTDGTLTIADFFDNDYIGTDKRVGLEGREEAARRLFNKIKVGLEGGVATAVVPKVVGTTLSGVAKVGAARVPGRDKSAAEILAYAPKKAIDTTKRLILQQEERVINGTAKTLDKAVGHALSMLRHRQFLDPESANVRSIINPTTEANIKIGRAKLKEIDKKIK